MQVRDTGNGTLASLPQDPARLFQWVGFCEGFRVWEVHSAETRFERRSTTPGLASLALLSPRSIVTWSFRVYFLL
jgi:hypothetical protein